jgi:hypothetical protein
VTKKIQLTPQIEEILVANKELVVCPLMYEKAKESFELAPI